MVNKEKEMKWLVPHKEYDIPSMCHWLWMVDRIDTVVEQRILDINNCVDSVKCVGMSVEDAVIFKLKYGTRNNLMDAIANQKFNFDLVDFG